MVKHGSSGLNIIKFLLTLAAIFALYLVSELAFFRIDLTTENKYSLSDESRQTLKSLDDVVYVKVFLDGELPADLVRFQRNIEETLEEFKAWAGQNLEYEFVNLYDEKNEEKRQVKMREIAEKGVIVTPLYHTDDEGGQTDRIIFPGALVSYQTREIPVNLLKDNPLLSYHENLTNSVETMEYEFLRAIKSLITEEVEKVVFIEGHGELDYFETYDIASELSLFFQVDRGRISGDLSEIIDYRAVIVAGPKSAFSEKEKFVLDQYLMHGGNLMFFVEPVEAYADSLQKYGRTYTAYQDPNIYDLIFKYGIKTGYNLVKDMQCNLKQTLVTVNNQEPQARLLPFWYNPLITAPQSHLITRNLNYIRSEFISAIDTTPAPIPGLKRTVLLSSSDSAAIVSNPAYIDIEEMQTEPGRISFTDSRIPLAILAEGEFTSFYKNYGIPEGVKLNGVVPRDNGTGSVFVAADADLIRNDVMVRNNQPIPQPLGQDRDTRQRFANKDFIMNLVNYVTGDRSLIELRSRDFKLRLLDRARIRVKSERIKWAVVNTLGPVLLVVFGGLFFLFVRKRKYS